MQIGPVEPEPTAPAHRTSRRTHAQAPPAFSGHLEQALGYKGRLADLKNGLTRQQVDRMLAGLPPGGFHGDFARMRPEDLKALGRMMRGEAGPVVDGEPRRYLFDPPGRSGRITRPA